MKRRKNGIIIQARISSTRMPGKVMLPFHNGKPILELLIERLSTDLAEIPVVIATSLNKADDPVERLVKRFPGVIVFRGDEDNVLKRYIDAADINGFEGIIRVCSDNIFIDTSFIRELLSESGKVKADYLSHRLKGALPAIRSHQGFYAEWVTTKVLRKVSMFTNDLHYLEHVTSFIYTHEKMFTIKWINAPEPAYSFRKLRLTIDTETDFRNCLVVYNRLVDAGKKINIQNVIETVNGDQELLRSMNEQIKQNSK